MRVSVSDGGVRDVCFFFQAEDGIRDYKVTGVQTCALPILQHPDVVLAVDAKDNIWVLHRPRTLPANQSAMAAPPVIVFDAAGNFIKAWGGDGDRRSVV